MVGKGKEKGLATSFEHAIFEHDRQSKQTELSFWNKKIHEDPQGDSQCYDAMTKFIVNSRTDPMKN